MFSIIVDAVPKPNAGPTTQNIEPGLNVEFNCGASIVVAPNMEEKLMIEWLFKSTKDTVFKSKQTKNVGKTDMLANKTLNIADTLELLAVKPSDGGIYQCKVTTFFKDGTHIDYYPANKNLTLDVTKGM